MNWCRGPHWLSSVSCSVSLFCSSAETHNRVVLACQAAARGARIQLAEGVGIRARRPFAALHAHARTDFPAVPRPPTTRHITGLPVYPGCRGNGTAERAWEKHPNVRVWAEPVEPPNIHPPFTHQPGQRVSQVTGSEDSQVTGSEVEEAKTGGKTYKIE